MIAVLIVAGVVCWIVATALTVVLIHGCDDRGRAPRLFSVDRDEKGAGE